MNSYSRENMQKYTHYQGPENSNRCHYCKGLCNDTKKESLISLPGREKLFNKVVTRSDIKQYRLAIPKHQAKKHFPPHVVSSSSNSPFLCMEDNEGKVWRFKYSFWKSSQGYMLTNEWNQFVKEKRVSVGDMVSFFRSNGPDKRLFIDWKPQNPLIDWKPQNPSGIVAKSEPLESTQNSRTVKLFGVNISTN